MDFTEKSGPGSTSVSVHVVPCSTRLEIVSVSLKGAVVVVVSEPRHWLRSLTPETVQSLSALPVLKMLAPPAARVYVKVPARPCGSVCLVIVTLPQLEIGGENGERSTSL